MKKTNNPIRAKFSVIVWCVLAVLLWAVPCNATTFVYWDQTLDVEDATYAEDSVIVFGGVLNLYPGAEVGWVSVWDGIANIYGGTIDGFLQVDASFGDPIVTIYGSDFAVNGVPLIDENGEPLSEFAFDSSYGLGELTGIYENGQPINGDPDNGLALQLCGGAPLHFAISAPEVMIDIKPGSDTNIINLKSKGVVPVAILTTGTFDAAEVDPATVLFAGAAPVGWALEDVDGDGDMDLLFHFRTQELNLDENSTEATLTARLGAAATTKSAATTSDAPTVSGTDKVKILSSKK